MRLRGLGWLAWLLAAMVVWGCGGSNDETDETGNARVDKLEIRDIAVFTTETSATVQWVSRRSGVGRVAYGVDPNLDQETPPESVPVTEHEVEVPALQPATRYLFQVVVDADNGNTYRSDVYFFYTRDGAPGKIAFISDRDGGTALYRMNEDGSNPVRLVMDAAQPDWSPDGQLLVFSSRRAGSNDLWLVEPDGGNLRPLTTTPDLEEWTPAWSPDGSRILYAAGGLRANRAEIYVLDLADPDNPVQLTDNVFLDEDPDWSPDGQQVVFVSHEGTATIELTHLPVVADSVQVSDEEGRPIPADEWTLDPATGVMDFSGASGGPGDRVQIVYQSLDGEGGAAVPREEEQRVPFPNREIFIMNADGSGRQRLTRNEAAEFAPVWSPSGDRILFVSDRDRNTEIYIMNTDGSNQTNLSGHPDGDLYPSWAPDGSAFTWAAKRDGLANIHRRGLESSQVDNLTRFSSGEGEPSWGS